MLNDAAVTLTYSLGLKLIVIARLNDPSGFGENMVAVPDDIRESPSILSPCEKLNLKAVAATIMLNNKIN